MEKLSIWQNSTDFSLKYNSLSKDIDVDILIIGGGITGCNTFYQLKDDNRKIALVEKNIIGCGASSRNTGKITYLQKNIYTNISKIYSKEKAYLYYKALKDTIKEYTNIITKENIDCSFKRSNSYLYTNSFSNIKKIEKEQEILSSFAVKTNYVNTLPNNMKVKRAFYVSNTYSFNPLKYIKGIIEKSISDRHVVYENTKIIKIDKTNNGYNCYTDNFVIRAKKVVLALHYPFFLLPFLMPLKCSLEKAFLTATIVKKEYNFNAINIDDKLNSISYYNNFLITASSSNNLSFATDDLKMLQDLKNNTNVREYDYAWSNYDLITFDKLPLIGYIDKNLILATGYNSWGNTNSLFASLIIKDLVNNKYNVYKELVDPKRAILKQKLIHYPLNIFFNGYSFINTKINKNKKMYNNNPYFINSNGKSIAVYVDSNSKMHCVYNKCPHLKCSLIFNQVEKTWDCPCHGSRFNLDGKAIMGPSNYDISIK